MTDPNVISDALRAPFPDSVIEQKQGKSYIGHEHIRERVIDATGNVFDWAVTSEEFRADGAVIRKDKDTQESYFAIVHRCNGVLTIPGLGSRHGTGSQVIERNAGEDTFKAAESDAFKRAAMAFGCGLQLYMSTPPAPRSRPTQQSPATATTSPEPTNRAMNDEQFRNAFAAALVNRNSVELKRLMDASRDIAPRWVEMVKLSQSVAHIEWIAGEMDKRGMGASNDYTAAAIARRKELEG